MRKLLLILPLLLAGFAAPQYADAQTVTGAESEVLANIDNSNINVTVPAAADSVVAFVCHYDGAIDSDLDVLTLNSVSFLPAESSLGDGQVADATGLAVYFLDAPATGTQNLAWSWDAGGDRAAGGQVTLVYIDDGTGPTEVRAAVSTHTVDTTISQAISTETTDLLLASGCGYSLQAAEINTANSTVLASDPFESSGGATPYQRVYSVTPLATSTDIDQTTPSFGGIVAISLRAGTASGSSLRRRRSQ